MATRQGICKVVEKRKLIDSKHYLVVESSFGRTWIYALSLKNRVFRVNHFNHFFHIVLISWGFSLTTIVIKLCGITINGKQWSILYIFSSLVTSKSKNLKKKPPYVNCTISTKIEPTRNCVRLNLLLQKCFQYQ